MTGRLGLCSPTRYRRSYQWGDALEEKKQAERAGELLQTEQLDQNYGSQRDKGSWKGIKEQLRYSLPGSWNSVIDIFQSIDTTYRGGRQHNFMNQVFCVCEKSPH